VCFDVLSVAGLLTVSGAAEIRRPVMRYHGGKARLAPWIISLLPEHRVYVEPFCGAASVLMMKPRSYAEVINDLDDQVVRTLRVMADPQLSEQLRARLELTPYARREFKDAYLPPVSEIDCAAKLLVRSFMGFGSAGTRNSSTGFRLSVRYRGTHQAKDWSRYPALIPAFQRRLRDVVIDNRDGIAVMAALDGSTTLHYVDPPYVHMTWTMLVIAAWLSTCEALQAWLP
jgi:DNA adenine methylase